MLTALAGARRAHSSEDFREAKRSDGIAFWGMCKFNFIRPWELDHVDAAHALGLMDTAELAYNRGTFIGTGCTEPNDPGHTEHDGEQYPVEQHQCSRHCWSRHRLRRDD
jgi:microsomal dipeptidase-like Zn-dependent dipeptidase